MAKERRRLAVVGLILWGLASGMVSPVQTAVNGKLRIALHSPFLASMVSFLIGTLTLIIITLAIDHRIRISRRLIKSAPWWLWVGGPLGVIFVTSNILLLPLLGAALSVVAVLCGQMVMALVVDHFGWFGVPRHTLNGPRFAGLALMIAGILLIQHF
ncbi:MAG: DMT family transporter [Sporolactobacillus sp.]